MMHNLLKLEEYQDIDKQFEESAKGGIALLQKTYDACIEFRRLFYTDGYTFGYTFGFPEAAMEKCSCKPREK